MQSTAESIARHLGGASKSGDQWSCRCPAHDDKRASLSITEKQDGKLLVHCHAGCDQALVVSELKSHGLWTSARPGPEALVPPPVQINLGAGKGQIAATYDYLNEDGELLYQAVRYEPKDFRQRAPNGHGGWTWSIKGVPRTLYRLPEVLVAVAEGRTVYICEGEKDVEAARALGLTATCNAMGADNGTGNKWLSEFGEIFRDADVVVIPDQDDAGIRHAEWVISTLQGKAKSVRVANPASGKDLSDWIAAGATVADIQAAAVDAFSVVEQLPQSNHISLGFQFFDVSDLISDIKPIDWLIKRFFESDSLALIYGAPGGGKSFFAVDVACSIATGTPWMSNDVKQGTVFYIAGEGHNGLARRFKAWETARGVTIEAGRIFKSGGAMQALDEASVKEVSDMIADQVMVSGEIPGAIVIDTLARNFGAGDENSTEDMSTFIQHVDQWLRRRFGCCVILVHHSGHNAERARGSSALKAAVDAEYEISKDDSGNIKIKTTKMKDAELPGDMILRLKGVELPGLVDEDGQPVTSAVLEVAGDLINTKIAERGDGTAITAREALEILDRSWLSARALGEALECSYRQANKVIHSLKNYGYVGTKSVTEEGKELLSRAGHHILGNDKPVWKRDQ
jgi:biotin operon repressor